MPGKHSSAINFRLLAFVAAVALLAAACSARTKTATHETTMEAREQAPVDTVYSLAEELGDRLDAFGKAMATVKEQPTVEQVDRARQAIAEVAAEIDAIAQRLQRLDVPPDEVKREIQEYVRDRERAMVAKLGGRVAFIESFDPDLRGIVRDAMDSFRSDIAEAGAIFERYFEVQK